MLCPFNPIPDSVQVLPLRMIPDVHPRVDRRLEHSTRPPDVRGALMVRRIELLRTVQILEKDGVVHALHDHERGSGAGLRWWRSR